MHDSTAINDSGVHFLTTAPAFICLELCIGLHLVVIDILGLTLIVAFSKFKEVRTCHFVLHFITHI